jgi:hypothetical protein
LSLLLRFPWVQNDTWYFPIKQARNPIQYVLGRAFLQNVYLISDYEREAFSVHSVRASESGMASLIRKILPGNATGTLNSWELDIPKNDLSGSHGTQKNSTGIIVASVLIPLCVLVIAYLVFLVSRKPKTTDAAASKKADTVENAQLPELGFTASQTPQEVDGIQKAELENLEIVEAPDRNATMAGYFTRAELDSGSIMHEMEGSRVAESIAKGQIV